MDYQTKRINDNYPAHIRGSDGTRQGVLEHCEGTASLARQAGEEYALPNVSYLAGLLHDLGKNSQAFSDYLNASCRGERVTRGSVTHSVQGAVFLSSFARRDTVADLAAAELIRCAVLSHHGLRDCVSTDGRIIYGEAKQKLGEDCEAVRKYVSAAYPEEKMRGLFASASEEIASIMDKVKAFTSEYPKEKYCSRMFVYAMLERLLTSILIDADRTDTACFENNAPHPNPAADRIWRIERWGGCLRNFNERLSGIVSGAGKGTSPLNVYRSEISDTCGTFDLGEGGVYRLVIPCGSGKTLASLRMALENARKYGRKRIIYVAPFNSILEQNASEIRRYVGEDCEVLEHHSGVVFDLGAGENEDATEEYKRYRLLTENWTQPPVIATTAVQFLDTLFSGKTSSVRRMQALSDSIIILDEVQALPVKVLKLFNSAVNFLSRFCSASVVLCSATQPPLDITDNYRMIKPDYIIHDTERYFRAFKRTEIFDRTTPAGFTYSGAADYISRQCAEVRSLLVIVNTKQSAREIYERIKALMSDSAEAYRVFHLSTSMCAAHRQRVLGDIRSLLADGVSERVVCVSTQLIEAGVDISFERVVRSLAGLDSVVQASGRCNRHGTGAGGQVHIINILDENVSRLPDIKKAQDAAREVLLEFRQHPETLGGDLLSEKAMERYYGLYFKSQLEQMSYPLRDNPDYTLLDLLTENPEGKRKLEQKGVNPKSIILKQAFGEAGRIFSVIDDNGNTDVIVKFDSTVQDSLDELSAPRFSDKKTAALRRLQRYTVGLNGVTLRALGNAVEFYPESGVYVLSDGYYHDEYGVSTSRVEDMKFQKY